MPQNTVARRKFFIGTLLMITIPIFTFFACYNYLLDGIVLSLTMNNRLTWSAVVSVLAVQVILVAFILSAMSEEDSGRNVFSRRERRLLNQQLRQQLTREANREIDTERKKKE
jgi:formate hydrogenlyase subunit 3/multisubunit Na+/H+ antiporter MnhD subunit